MRVHRVEEVKVQDLAKYLNDAVAEGREIAAILDGTITRSTYVLVVSYTQELPKDVAPVSLPIPPAPVPPRPVKPRRKH